MKYPLLFLTLFSTLFGEETLAVAKKSIKNAPPETKRNGYFVALDGFFWKASEDGLQYATEVTGIANQGRIYHGKQKSPSFGWDPGFRLEVGFLSGTHDEWSVSGKWTHFNTSAHHSISNLNGTSAGIIAAWAPVFFAILQQRFIDNIFTNSHSKHSLHYNTYDLLLGRDFCLSKQLTTHPSLGIRYATINQNNRSRYSTPLDDHLMIKGKSKFHGAGIRLGTDLLWSFNQNWGALGKIGGSLLYGRFQVSGKTNLNNGAVFNTITNPFNAGRVNIDGALGLQWQNHVNFWSSKKWRCVVGLFYEMTEWFSQNQLVEVISNISPDAVTYESRQGDLFLQGATLHVDFEF